MPTYTQPRPVVDRAQWAPGASCPMATRDPYNFPIVASTPHDWYRPRIFVSGCENPANVASGSSSAGGGSFLYDPSSDAWEDIPHFIGMDPSYSVAGTYSHGAATFHPQGPSGQIASATSTTAVIDKYLAGNVAVGVKIRITGGTGAGQTRTITGSQDWETYTDYVAPTFKGMTTATSASASSLAVNKPALCADGDMLVAVVFNGWSTATLPNSVPAGWTLQDGPRGGAGTSGAIYTKVASGEPASWTWGWGGSGKTDLYVLCYSGVAAVDAASGMNTGAFADCPYAPSMSVTRNNSTLVMGVFNGWSALGVYQVQPMDTVASVSSWSAVSTGVVRSGQSLPVAWPGGSDGRTGVSAVILRPSVQQTLVRSRRVVNAPIVVGKTSNEANVNLAVSVPAGTANGDLMVATISKAANGHQDLTTPAGWTRYPDFFGANSEVTVFYRVANAEPGSYTWTGSTTLLGRIITFRNATEGGVSAWIQGVSTTLNASIAVAAPGARVIQHTMTGATYSAPSLSFADIDGWSPFTPATDNRLFGGVSQPVTTTFGAVPPTYSYTCGGNGDTTVFTTVLPTQSPTGTTLLTVDSPWSVTPDATSTYAIDSGSFWVWRGNSSDSIWRWAKYDIAQGTWEKKTATDAVATPTYVNSVVYETPAGGSTAVVGVPSGVVDGDLLLVMAAVNQNATTPPAGWTLLADSANSGGNASRFVCYYRFASSEPASYTWGVQSGQGCVFHCHAFRSAGTPTPVAVSGNASPLRTYSANATNIHTLPALIVSMVGNRQGGNGVDAPASSNDTQVAAGSASRSGYTAASAAAASANTTYTWTIGDLTSAGYAMGVGLVLVPGVSPGMSNYGKSDPSRQGGIHAVTDDANYIWLGGDAQTSLRRYSISGDSWSASAAHSPYTSPMRNPGGGMVLVKDLPGWASNGRYIYYVCPDEVSNVYDAIGRLWRYDTQTDAWTDQLTDPGAASMPGQFCQVASVNGRIIWNTPISRKVYVHRPDLPDTLLPEALLGAPSRGSMNTMGCSMHPITLGGERYLYMMEHTNSQEISPFRTRLRNVTWAGG